MYQTIFCTAYYGLFRIVELASGDHPVLARDVKLGQNKKKALFILRTSKTHWKNNKPQTIKISSEKNTQSKRQKENLDLPCHYELLKKYSKLQGLFR